MSGDRCPACDAETHTLTQLESIALGVALGSAFHMHGITDMVCDRHRAAYLLAGMKMTMKINAPELASLDAYAPAEACVVTATADHSKACTRGISGCIRLHVDVNAPMPREERET